MSEPQSTKQIEHFSEKFFDDIAKIDVGWNYFSPVWADAVAAAGRIENMLDIGCGNGVFSAEVKKRTGCRLVGVDGSEYALAQARTIGFDALSLIGDFNSDPLPYPAEQFDFALCKDLLEHLLRPDFVIGEAFRVLKPGGFLLAHVPNHFTLKGRIRFLFDNDIDTYRFFPGATRWNFPHVRFYTHSSMVSMLELAGFRIAADLSKHFPSLPLARLIPSKSVRSRLAEKSPSQFAGGFTLLGQKPALIG